MTAFPEMPSGDRDARPAPLLNPTADDAVTLVYSDGADERRSDVAEFADRTLTAAVSSFASELG